MIREMTLGQYYPADSVIHRLDPRVKLAGTLIFIITIFIINDPAAYVFAALFLGFVIVLSKVPFRYMVKGLKNNCHYFTVYSGAELVFDARNRNMAFSFLKDYP